MPSRFLAVKGFRKFQHYRDRDPVWIKLYTNLLIDAAFLQLPEVAQAQLMKLWILASQLGNPLPNNPKLLAGKIGTSGKFHLAAIIDAGFLIATDDPSEESASESGKILLAESEEVASKPASTNGAKPEENASASVRASARSRGERELELERETTQSVFSSEHERLLKRLAADSDRGAVNALLRKVPVLDSWIAEMHASLDGMSGHHHVTPEQLGECVRDFIGNGGAKDPKMRHFRSYIERAGKTRAPAVNGAAKSDDVLDRWARGEVTTRG